MQTRQSLCSVLMKLNDDKNQQARISLTKFPLFSQNMPSLFLPRGSKERQTQPISKARDWFCHHVTDDRTIQRDFSYLFLKIFIQYALIIFFALPVPPHFLTHPTNFIFPVSKKETKQQKKITKP